MHTLISYSTYILFQRVFRLSGQYPIGRFDLLERLFLEVIAYHSCENGPANVMEVEAKASLHTFNSIFTRLFMKFSPHNIATSLSY